jgi:L-iditol 2-dehydrogenase
MVSMMEALVLTAPKEFEIRQIPVPGIGPNEVLCRVKSVAICGSDPGFISGKTAGVWPPHYPFTIGHEWSGVVEAVGANVTMWKKGDKVVGEAHNGCGICRNCKEGRYNLCLNYDNPKTEHRHYGHKDQGAFAEYGVFNQKSLTALPENVSFDIGAIVDAAGTALHVETLTGITPGGTVAIIGPGPIGLIAGKVARALGASRIIVIGRGPRLAKAKELGIATETVDFESQDAVKTIEDLTGGIGCDEVFECSGAAGTLDQAIHIVKRGGKIGLVGIPAPGSMEPIPNRMVVIKEIAIQGSRANPNVMDKLLSMLAAGTVSFDDIVTHSFQLKDFKRALDTFLDRSTGALKVIVHP